MYNIDLASKPCQMKRPLYQGDRKSGNWIRRVHSTHNIIISTYTIIPRVRGIRVHYVIVALICKFGMVIASIMVDFKSFVRLSRKAAT